MHCASLSFVLPQNIQELTRAIARSRLVEAQEHDLAGKVQFNFMCKANEGMGHISPLVKS